MEKLSPRYKMRLIDKVVKAIWDERHHSYKEVMLYIQDWQNKFKNFYIFYKDASNTKIDLPKTLLYMGEDLLIKIAIDMGIETPGFIPCVPTFRNDLKQRCPSAIGTFEKAFKCVETDPSTAIGLANSALESIIKRILSDDRITAKWKDTETLHKLTDVLLREFKLHPSDSIPEEVRNISSSLLTIARQIEKLRSEKSEFHGKTPEGEIITDPTYAYLCINSVSTVGSFLLSYYTEHYPEPAALSPDNEDDDLPF